MYIYIYIYLRQVYDANVTLMFNSNGGFFAVLVYAYYKP